MHHVQWLICHKTKPNQKHKMISNGKKLREANENCRELKEG